MKALVLSAVLLAALPALAGDYQDGTLVNFRTVNGGTHCSTTGNTQGTVNASTHDNGYSADTTGTLNATTNSDTDCYNEEKIIYSISMAGHSYLLKASGFSGNFGSGHGLISSHLRKKTALYGLLPGTPIQIRSEGGDSFYVKAGKHESKYYLVGAE